MTPRERIARLEALLVRVRARSESRAAIPPAGERDQDMEMTIEIDMKPSLPLLPPLPRPPPLPPRPAPPRPPPPRRDAHVGPGDIAPLAAPMAESPPRPPPDPTLEPIIDLEKRKFPASLESVERVRAASPFLEDVTIEEPLSPAPEDRVSDVPSTVESAPPPDMTGVDDLMMDDAPAPSSSRRPVGPPPEERLAEMAFGEHAPPALHTPPPESGPLPAVPQEDFEFDADITGVREAPKTSTTTAAEPVELVPQITRAALDAPEAVIDVLGQAQRFAPRTFGELLDASLAL